MDTCGNHASMTGSCCARCGLHLQTEPDFRGRVFRIGQSIAFRNNRGVPYDGTVIEIHDGPKVKVKYADRAWKADTYDLIVDVKDVAESVLELSYNTAGRERRKVDTFAAAQAQDILSSSITAAEKKFKAKQRREEQKRKKKETETITVENKKIKAAVKKTSMLIGSKIKHSDTTKKLALRKSIPPAIYCESADEAGELDGSGYESDKAVTEVMKLELGYA